MQVTMQGGRVVVEPTPTSRRVPLGAGSTLCETLPLTETQRLQVIYRAIKLDGYAFGRHATEYLEDVFNHVVRADADTQALIALGVGVNRDEIRQRIEARLLELSERSQ
ncbi:hypothetical protein [Bordetella avium]|nr:hypothetical protein [Bordetella avium]UOK17047.1 hypothetical protein vBBaMIFTN1_45 [Bordetella phage vB_BaM-IFTN1]UOK17176.1 hypothetical protein vBBaMIFTN3_47 [Bordetella phage vB_BaM-IFTN3]UOK17238.1 hypothetical protein vBBaMIFTN4_46 [Bordetella phage vB_BaM-IFTN4]UOK17313.1 hypothetical protein vBBaMIFTN5_49 [Bordetella phage vB_BaM-IFTN5]UOK17380.1 hypothetical protein vBBaMIFTN6_47 [Bordetella phage vB_BaM-IFTN6]UOK17446.1 hypothetical protein vBBaMIFTN7_49 [Bordetella phage vB_BaM